MLIQIKIQTENIDIKPVIFYMSTFKKKVSPKNSHKRHICLNLKKNKIQIYFIYYI